MFAGWTWLLVALAADSAPSSGGAEREARVRQLLDEGRVSTARTLAHEWWIDHPDDPASWRLIALAAEPGSEEARLALMRADALKPDDPQTLLALAGVEEAGGNWGPAQVYYDRAAALDPSWEARLGGARMAARLRTEDAFDRAASLTDAWPDRADGWLLLARGLDDPLPVLDAGAEHSTDARLLEERAVHGLIAGRPLDPDVASAWIDDARSCLDAGLDRADLAVLEPWRKLVLVPAFGVEERLDALAEKAPGCALTHRALASFHDLHGDPARALEPLQRAWDLDPESPDLAAALGTALLRADRPDEAWPLLERAVEGRPADVELWLTTAELALDRGRGDLAAAWLARAAEVHPADGRIPLARAASIADPAARLDLLLEALAEAPYDDALLERALVVAGPLDRTDEVHRAVIWPRALADRVARSTDEVGAHVDPAIYEIEVWSQQEVDRRRAALEQRLASMGYGEGRRTAAGTFFAAARKRPAVLIRDDGLLEIQSLGFLPADPVVVDIGTQAGSAAGNPNGMVTATAGVPIPKFYNKRQMGPLRWKVLQGIGEELKAWRGALASHQTRQRIETVLPDQLDRLWFDGVPLRDGPRLKTHAARREALLDLWASRLCTPEGQVARAAVGRFLAHEVVESDHPLTRAELDRANRERLCGPPLMLPTTD